MASDYRYSVHFEDGRRVTTNYMGDVLQVDDVFTFEARNWVITDAKALGEREVDFRLRDPRTPCRGGISRSWHTFHGLAEHLLRSHPYGVSANFWSCPALPIVFAPDAPVPAG